MTKKLSLIPVHNPLTFSSDFAQLKTKNIHTGDSVSSNQNNCFTKAILLPRSKTNQQVSAIIKLLVCAYCPYYLIDEEDRILSWMIVSYFMNNRIQTDIPLKIIQIS